MSSSFQLSIEEVAVSIASLGHSEAAAGFLQSITGDLTSDQLSGRLTAATHSLISRELLNINLTNESSTLQPDLARSIGVMLRSTIGSVRCAKTHLSGEKAVTFFADHEGWLEYIIDIGVVSRFTLHKSIADVTQRICEFSGVRDGDSDILGKISGDSLQILRSLASEQDTSGLQQQIQKQLGDPIAAKLASAMTSPQAEWGTILHLTTSADLQGIEANRGLFYLNAANSTWLFDAVHGDAMLTVSQASKQSMADTVNRLLLQVVETGNK